LYAKAEAKHTQRAETPTEKKTTPKEKR